MPNPYGFLLSRRSRRRTISREFGGQVRRDRSNRAAQLFDLLETDDQWHSVAAIQCGYSLAHQLIVIVGNLLDQLNDGQPQAIMINSPECLQQPIGMWPGELVKNQLLVGVRHLSTCLPCKERHSTSVPELSQALDFAPQQQELLAGVMLSACGDDAAVSSQISHLTG